MNEVETKPKRKPMRYMTPSVLERFQSEEIIQGNGSVAVRVLEPMTKNVGDRAYRLRKAAEKSKSADYVPKQIQQIAVGAIRRIGAIVDSTDEHVALKASMFVIDHAIGKAVQRNENHNVNLNIESVLE